MPEILRAQNFAKLAHAGQVRKYTGEPYFNHCEEVAALVREIDCNKAMIAAAYLHDTLEDTDTTLGDLYKHFGHDIGNMVNWVTDVSHPTDGNRAYRKTLDREHIAKAPRAAQTIKMADLASNTRSIVEHDPDFAKVYLKEKLLLLRVMTKIDRRFHHYITRKTRQVLSHVEKGNLPLPA